MAKRDDIRKAGAAVKNSAMHLHSSKNRSIKKAPQKSQLTQEQRKSASDRVHGADFEVAGAALANVATAGSPLLSSFKDTAEVVLTAKSETALQPQLENEESGKTMKIYRQEEHERKAHEESVRERENSQKELEQDLSNYEKEIRPFTGQKSDDQKEILSDLEQSKSEMRLIKNEPILKPKAHVPAA